MGSLPPLPSAHLSVTVSTGSRRANGARVTDVSAEGLARFRDLVLADTSLQRQLRSLPSHAEFVARTVALAAEHGCSVTPEDVDEALAAHRRAWFERWT